MEVRNTNFVFKQNRKDNWNEILTMGDNRKEAVNCNNFMFKCEYRGFCGKCLNQFVHIVLIITIGSSSYITIIYKIALA